MTVRYQTRTVEKEMEQIARNGYLNEDFFLMVFENMQQ